MKKKLFLVLTALCVLLLAMPSLAAERTVFTFDNSVRTLYAGETLQTILNRSGDAAEGELTYSTKSKLITVDQNGVVTGLDVGTAKVTATVKNGKKTFTATLSVTIQRRPESAELNTQNLWLTAADDQLISWLLEGTNDDVGSVLEADSSAKVVIFQLNRSYSLQYSVLPKDVKNRRASFAVTDDTVIQLRGNTLKPLRTGSTLLIVASEECPEITTTYVALVIQPVTRLTVTAADRSVFIGRTLQCSAAITPNEASIKDVTWASSNTKVATVDEDGVVTGLARGSTRITATSADGTKRQDDIYVNVQQPPTGVTVTKPAVSLEVGKYVTLQARVTPNNAVSTDLVWESSDPSVATVSTTNAAANAKITAVSRGECEVRVYSRAFPKVSTTCMVKVIQPVTGIAFRGGSASVIVGESARVYWDVTPSDATDPSVTLTSNNTKVASVDQNGTIYGNYGGTATITATANDGSRRRGQIKVTVIQPVNGVHMKNDTVRVGVNEKLRAQAVMEPSNATNKNMTWTSADTSIATVSGTDNRPTVSGRKWGTTTITGVTEDGGYKTTCTVNVGNLDKALKVTNLYLQDNEIKIVVHNESNMNITRFYYTIECYDMKDGLLAVTSDGENVFDGSYRYTLYPDDSTKHGKFSFGSGYVGPAKRIGRVTITITGYRTDEGIVRNITEDRRIYAEYRDASWYHATPTPPPAG